MADRGIRREVVGWYLPVSVVDEKALTRAGVRVVVQMRRVAVGRSAGAYTQAVGIRCRREWCKHTTSKRELVGMVGRLAQSCRWAGGGVSGGTGGARGVDWSST